LTLKRKQSFQSQFQADLPRSPLGHKLMFLLLSLLAFCLFTPTVMLPKLRQYGELLREEQKIKDRVAELGDEARRRAELTEAFARDTIVNERLAVLDLSYRKPNEEVYAVLTDESIEPVLRPADPRPPRSALLLPDNWPRWTTRAETWADNRGLIDLFLDPTVRPVFLLMSGGLLISAFVLFAPRIPGPAPRHTSLNIASRHVRVHRVTG
jgi:hypothetical protein